MTDTVRPRVPTHRAHASLERLNALRAGVLGANDGIVSVAGLGVAVSGAGTEGGTVALAGIAGLVAGALSMAGGEYVSVSAQRDTERSVPGGVPRSDPWQAARVSLATFAAGAVLPLLAMILAPADLRVGACVVVVLLSLALTGMVGARLGGAPIRPALARTVGVGGLTMTVGYGVGVLFGVVL